jgi:hypothetical protein
VAVDAVHPDDRRVVGGIVVDHNPASNNTRTSGRGRAKDGTGDFQSPEQMQKSFWFLR